MDRYQRLALCNRVRKLPPLDVAAAALFAALDELQVRVDFAETLRADERLLLNDGLNRLAELVRTGR